MHMGSIVALQGSIVATAAIAERRFVTYANAQAEADEAVKAVSAMTGVAGDALPVTYVGVVDMIAGAEIAAPGPVISSADGLPVPKGAGANVAGYALNAAAVGARVQILIR